MNNVSIFVIDLLLCIKLFISKSKKTMYMSVNWKNGMKIASIILSFFSFFAKSNSEPALISSLDSLRLGNNRFASELPAHPNQSKGRRFETAIEGQKPFATVLSCSDSRVPAEIIFDCGIGDIFTVRVAGNVAGDDEIASIEFGVGNLHTPVLVVLGHTKCGAVTSAVNGDNIEGLMHGLIQKIIPAVNKAKKANPKLHGDDLIYEAIKSNVYQSISDILKQSEEVRNLVKTGKLQVIGAIYDIKTGNIEWLGNHPDESNLVKLTTTEEKSKEQKREGPFFANKNLMFMAIFVVVCALLSGGVIFLFLNYIPRKKKEDIAEDKQKEPSEKNETKE